MLKNRPFPVFHVHLLPFLILGGLMMLLASCSAHSPSILKDNHRTIHVSVFHNNTQQYALEERLTRSVIASFQRDGRLRVARSSMADLRLTGTIQTATIIPVGYTDLDRAIGYNLAVHVTVSVEDVSSGEFLMQDRPFSASGTYLLTNEPSSARAQDVADNVAEQILSALIEGW